MTVLFRWILVIPQWFVVVVLGIAVWVVSIVGWFAVLILGRWPTGLRDFMIGYFRWRTRVPAYLWLIVDDYPPFGFEE